MAQAALSTVDRVRPSAAACTTREGQMRTVGVEVEFAGPSAEKTIRPCRRALAGR